jgi:uncharacterized membrane protein
MERARSFAKSGAIAGRILAFSVVGVILLIWLLNTPPGLLGKADAIGYAVCHRIDLRSFHLGERQLPLCIRCSGMYLGAVLGLAYQAFSGRRSAGFAPRRVWLIFGLLAAAFAVDGINSYLHLFPGAPGLYEPQHWLRLLTGSGMGLAMAAVLYPAFLQTILRGWDRTPVFPGLRSLAPLLVLALALDALVWTQNPLVLYPLALISAAGVALVLTLVYTLVCVMVFHLENRIERLSQLVLPTVCGLGLAFLQIGGLDLLRFLFTGSWDGFHIG